MSIYSLKMQTKMSALEEHYQITLKQVGWQLTLRCSMVILASLPTCSPQYVQVEDSEALQGRNNSD